MLILPSAVVVILLLYTRLKKSGCSNRRLERVCCPDGTVLSNFHQICDLGGVSRLAVGRVDCCLENGTLVLVDRVLARHAGMVSEQLLLGVGVNTLYFRMFTCHVSPWKHALMPVFPPADLRH